MSSLLHLGHGDISHIKFLVGCFALFVVSSNVDCYTFRQLELFQERILKQILSLPMSCPDPAVYILTGILPIEAQIHIKALTFFNNVCHRGERIDYALRLVLVIFSSTMVWILCFIVVVLIPK
jgi:hypothetical protein